MLRGLAVLVSTPRVEMAADQSWQLVGPGSHLGFLIVVPAAAAVAARRFPLVALVLAAMMDALPYWLHVTGLGYHVGFLICLYMAVVRCSRRTAVAAAALATLVQVVLMAHEKDWQWTNAFVLTVTLTNIVAITLGHAARARRATVEALRARADEVERSRAAHARKLMAEDRLRVARNLHDSVAHQIAVMNLNAAAASTALPHDPKDAERALVVIREAGREVMSSISDLLAGLRQDEWDEVEANTDVEGLARLVMEFRKLLPATTLEVTGSGVPENVPVHAETFMVVREGLTNAYKHGDHGSPVRVHLDRGVAADTVTLSNHLRSELAVPASGYGLQGMRERVEAAGGRVETSVTDGTFHLVAYIPLNGGRP